MHRALPGLCLAVLVSLPSWALNAGLGPTPPALDRQSPHATVQGFLDSAHHGDYARAAHFLDLDFLPRAEQAERGAQLARRLKFVLDRKLPVDLSALSKAAEGDPSDARYDLLGTVPLEDGSVQAIRLRRVVGEGGQAVWVFSESTVKAIDRLFDLYGPLLAETLPPVFFEHPVLGLEPWQWLGLLVVLGVGLLVSLVLERLALAVAARMARWTRVTWDDALVAAGKGPLRLPFYAGLLAAGTSALQLPRPTQTLFDRVAYSLAIVSVAWFVLRFLRVMATYIQERVSADSRDAARARGVRTQLAVLRHVFEAATYVIAAALLLMQFEVVRNVGVSLLASAGIAGIVLGLAAQKSISSLLAGIQLSITQPVRIGDQVVVENEFGTVEEITLTYVVVQIWDQRRLVIPITQFLDKPFQNWSKGPSPDLMGVVLLQVDFTTDIEELRAELRRVLETHGREKWDGRVATVVVLEVMDRTMQVRVLVSAASAGALFDLRCIVREHLIYFLRSRPEWLPITRTEARAPVVAAPPAAETSTPPQAMRA
ncbi:mechanosensitive ion channel family protein [Myxococcaceae bacterium GXIMD 01537]